MQHLFCRQMSLVTMIITLSLAGAARAQIDTLAGCVSQWRATAQSCCAENDPEIKDLCFDMANDQLAACLIGLAPTEKPSSCWNYAINLEQTNCGGIPQGCNSTQFKTACRRAARTIYRWCIGLDPSVSASNATPTWRQHPATITVGNAYQLVVSTMDIAVERVRFFAIRMDAPPTAADTVFELGSAAAQPAGGNGVLWRLTTDTGTWPLEAGEQHVVIMARSEAFTSPTATQILDISTLIEVEIE